LTRFEHLTSMNSRVKTNTLHIILNFDRDDKPDVNTLQQIAAAYMEKIGFGDQPYLVYQHKDASHPHLHIVTTNVQVDGNRISIHNIGKTCQKQAAASGGFVTGILSMLLKQGGICVWIGRARRLFAPATGHEFKARFERWGYTHRIAVLIGETTFTFEPDEEGGYRAMTNTEQPASTNKVDVHLLRAVAEKLAKLSN
jgi:hypothetical protein